MRGQLTQEVQAVAKQHLNREISLRELRLMPYIQYTLMNNQKIDPNKINGEERRIISEWKTQGWCEGGMAGFAVSKNFWDAINQILWVGYVDYDD